MRLTAKQISTLDGATKFRLVTELKREMNTDGCTDERAAEILTEIRAIEGKPRATRKTKEQRERFMTVLGGYKLDMENHGALVREYIDMRTGERYETSSAVDRY